eukprot:scaffold2767_cov177-Amphora_coffeaeformis.AAC.54
MARDIAATSCGECAPGKASRIAGDAAVLTDVFTDETEASAADPAMDGFSVRGRSGFSSSGVGVRGRRPSSVADDPTTVEPSNCPSTVASDPDPPTVSASKFAFAFRNDAICFRSTAMHKDTPVYRIGITRCLDAFHQAIEYWLSKDGTSLPSAMVSYGVGILLTFTTLPYLATNVKFSGP